MYIYLASWKEALLKKWLDWGGFQNLSNTGSQGKDERFLQE